MIRVSTTTSSSGDDVKGQRLGRGEHRPAFSSRLHSCPPTLSLASSALLHPPSLTSVALTCDLPRSGYSSAAAAIVAAAVIAAAAAAAVAAAAVAAAATVATVAARPPVTR